MAADHLTLIDGAPASSGSLSGNLFAGFAHFTAMQVRGGGVRGLDLHLDRLLSASQKLFAAPLPAEQVRNHLREALASSPSDLSLTVTVFDSNGEFTNDGQPPSLHTLIRTGPAADGPRGPLALALFEHERFMPDIKHVGEGAKTYFMRLARASGFDDAAFAYRRGMLTEASIWNLAFLDGDTVVWSDANILTGTMMGIIKRQLTAMGVAQETRPLSRLAVHELDAAVVMNSWTPGISIHRIADERITVRPDLVAMLHDAYAAELPAHP